MTLSDLLDNQRRFAVLTDSEIKITQSCLAQARAFYEVPDDVDDAGFKRWAYDEIPTAAARSTMAALRLICVVSYVGAETSVSVVRCLQIISLVAGGMSVNEAVGKLSGGER